MALDYSLSCVNFRDVGECLNLLAEDGFPAGYGGGCVPLPTRRLLRGGKLAYVERAEQIGCPGTIINLRKGPDTEETHFGAEYWHFPISNDYDKYNTADPAVHQWLVGIFHCLSEKVKRFPVFFHCTSGKDRTGVVIAALLAVLGVERECIVREYLWSDGEVERRWIETALDGIGNPKNYFNQVDLPAICGKFLCPYSIKCEAFKDQQPFPRLK